MYLRHETDEGRTDWGRGGGWHVRTATILTLSQRTSGPGPEAPLGVVRKLASATSNCHTCIHTVSLLLFAQKGKRSTESPLPHHHHHHHIHTPSVVCICTACMHVCMRRLIQGKCGVRVQSVRHRGMQAPKEGMGNRDGTHVVRQYFSGISGHASTAMGMVKGGSRGRYTHCRRSGRYAGCP